MGQRVIKPNTVILNKLRSLLSRGVERQHRTYIGSYFHTYRGPQSVVRGASKSSHFDAAFCLVWLLYLYSLAYELLLYISKRRRRTQGKRGAKGGVMLLTILCRLQSQHVYIRILPSLRHPIRIPPPPNPVCQTVRLYVHIYIRIHKYRFTDGQ